MIIKNCRITKQDSEVLNHTDTYIELSAQYVYAVCDSVVIDVSKTSATLYRVILQYDNIISVLYNNLKVVNVASGHVIKEGTKLGECQSKTVHFEYLTQTKFSSTSALYLGGVKYYKQDPISIADNTFIFDSDIRAYDFANSILEVQGKSSVTPYIITVGESDTKLDIQKLKEARVSAVLLFGGSLYDEAHMKRARYSNKNLTTQYNKFIKHFAVAEYFYVRARSVQESNSEIDNMKSVLRNNIPDLGVWLRIQFTQSVSVNDAILDNYIKKLSSYGFNGKIGLYCTRQELSKVSWDKFQDSLLLWLIDYVKSTDEITLTPDTSFFNL